MFGTIGKLINKGCEMLDALVNDQELQGVVAASVLVAAADGKITEEEKETAFRAISAHPSLKSFDQKKIRSYFDADVSLINADHTLAQEVLYDKVSTIRDRVARIRVLGVANQIANADGEFSDAEKRVIDKLRRLTA